MQDGRFLLCIWTSVMTSSVTWFVAECQLTYWLTISDVSCLRDFCAFCRPSEQAAYLQLTSLSGYFQMRRSSWFSAKNHKNPHLPPWVTSHKKKKNPIVSNNQRKGKPVSEPSQIVLLHPSFLVSRFIIILWLAWAISVTIYLGNHYKNRCRTSVFVLYTALASLFYSFLLALRPHSAAAIFEDWSGDNNKQFNRGLCDPSEQLHEFANHSEYWLLGFFTVLPFQTSLVNEQSGRRHVGGNLKFSTQASGVE